MDDTHVVCNDVFQNRPPLGDPMSCPFRPCDFSYEKYRHLGFDGLGKGISFGCFHNMRFFFASIKASTKLWFAWLCYNIIDIVFMIFGIFIKIVEFVMA